MQKITVMKTFQNLRNSKIDNSALNASKLKSIYVVEEDLDSDNLHLNGENSEKTTTEELRLQQIKRYNYLCYLRSCDDMV